MFLLKMIMLQSHARAIHHSDRISLSRTKCLTSVTIPRSGNPSFRPLCKIPLAWTRYGYNPTLGQSIIPTRYKIHEENSQSAVTIPRSGNPSFRQRIKLSTSFRVFMLQSHARAIHHSDLTGMLVLVLTGMVTIPRSGNPSFRPCLAALVNTSGFVLQSHARAIHHSDVLVAAAILYFAKLQSHARAIHHSDFNAWRAFQSLVAVTIPRSGNPSFRLFLPYPPTPH